MWLFFGSPPDDSGEMRHIEVLEQRDRLPALCPGEAIMQRLQAKLISYAVVTQAKVRRRRGDHVDGLSGQRYMKRVGVNQGNSFHFFIPQ